MDVTYKELSDFSSLFNKSTKEKTLTTYGTITTNGMVKIDGSNTETPYVNTISAKSGDRVLLLFKDHSLVTIGNVSNPGGGGISSEEISEYLKDYPTTSDMINAISEGNTTTLITAEQFLENRLTNYATSSSVSREIIDKTDELSNTIKSTYTTKLEFDQKTEVLQYQIDGTIETFTGSQEPTLENAPTSDWLTNEEKEKHIGDLYYGEEGSDIAGYCYRFQKDSDGIYGWVLIKDTDVTKALADASNAVKDAAKAATDALTAIGKIDDLEDDLLKNYSTTEDAEKNLLEHLKSYSKTEDVETWIKQEIDKVSLGVQSVTEELADFKTDTENNLKDYAKTTDVNTNISIAIDNIKLDASKTYTTKVDFDNLKEDTDTKLKDYVTTTTYNSYVQTTSKSIDLVSSKVSTVETNLDKKVSTNEIISKINVTPETIKISSSHLDITGLVTFSSFDSSLQSDYNSTKSTANTAKTTADSAATVADLARMMADGKLLYTDPTFLSGSNSVTIYNNSGNGTVTVVRNTKSTYGQTSCPTTSNYIIRIQTNGSASPGRGGFFQNITSRANAVFVIKYLILLPTGYSLSANRNSIGTNGTDAFVGDIAGTGTWKEYYRLIKCGSSGTFSTSGYVSISGGSASTAVTWYLGAIYAYDVTDVNPIENWRYGNTTYINGGDIYTGSITANSIAANTITADKINITDLFSKNITATGTIAGAKITNNINVDSVQGVSEISNSGFKSYSSNSKSILTIYNGNLSVRSYNNDDDTANVLITNSTMRSTNVHITNLLHLSGGTSSDPNFKGHIVPDNAYSFGLSSHRWHIYAKSVNVEGAVVPSVNSAYNLGSSALKWLGCYATNFYENGTALSSKYNQLMALKNISAISTGTTIASTANISSMTSIGALNVAKGTWLITAYVGFSTNGNGTRAFYIGPSAGYSKFNAMTAKHAAPVPGVWTPIYITTAIVATSTTKIYMNVWQNSGSTLTTECYYWALELSSNSLL